MKKIKHEIECSACNEEFIICCRKKAVLLYCPFCGESTEQTEDPPLLDSFEDFDEYDEEEDDYYEEDDEE